MASSEQIRGLLISLPIPSLEDDRRQPPGGCVSIASAAARAGFSVQVCDLAGVPVDQICDRVPDADVYGIGTYTANYHIAAALAKQLRQRNPRPFLVAGGPHASALPEATSADFDCVVCGEGEEAFVEVLSRVAARQADRLPKIKCGRPIEDLDALPFPDFERFCDMHSYSRRLGPEPAICLDSSRGCNHRCRFCNSRVNDRGHWRARSPQSVAAEVRRHWERGWRAFRWNDDNFLADPERARSICDLLPTGVSFRIFARAESLCDLRLCERLRAAGCVHVGVGAETLSAKMLALMGKATRVDRIIQGVSTARAAGITVRGFFITGFPGETEDTVAETLRRLEELPLQEACVYPCIPYPGTDLFARPGDYGIVWVDPDFSKYLQIGRGRAAGFVMRTTTFGPDDVYRWREQFMVRLRDLGMAWSDERGEYV